MTTIPIILTFDNNMSLPAAVCISSMMMSAKEDTFYDFFVLHAGEPPVIVGLDKIKEAYPNMRLQYRSVGDAFSGAFEIRGITAAAYYRLLAPELVPEYEKAIYADVDMVIRLDMTELYNMDMDDNYLGAVYGQTFNLEDAGKEYVKSLGIKEGNYFLSGFLLMDLKKMRRDSIVDKFKAYSKTKYKYQDQDIMNIVCEDRIMSIPFEYSMVDGAFELVAFNSELLKTKYMHSREQGDPFYYSNIHFNGVKPWRDFCPNFDQWWECYRKSPVFDEQFYFKFFYNKLESLDKLPLLKRIKILVRYFVYGRKKDI